MSTLVKKYKKLDPDSNLLSEAEKIVFQIMDDLTGRGGFSHAWYDTDESTKEDILKCWTKIVKDNLDEFENYLDSRNCATHDE